MRTLLSSVSILLFALAGFAQAQSAPQQTPKEFELVYRFLLNGQYLGNVTDTFRRDGDRYLLTSTAKPEGKLAMLLPTLTLTSEGKIQQRRFLPSRFSQVRSHAQDKTAVAQFDWDAGQLTHQYKGTTRQLPLPAKTLDALVQLYSFTQLNSLPAQIELPVTNARKLMTYRYEKQAPARVEAALGTFDAVEYRRLAGEDENAISVWIAPALHNLPLRVRVREESGIFEQQLVQIHFR